MAHAGHIIGTLFIAMAMAAPDLMAQPIYRCANSYSQTPCPGGTALDVDDSRSPAQSAQTTAATVQAVRMANDMEKARLKGEQIVGKTPRTPASTSKSMPVNGAVAKPGREQKDKQPAPFVAFAPAQQKPLEKNKKIATPRP